MTEKIVFIADDGTEFEYEDDCREYEVFNEITPILDNIQMWDGHENPIPIPKNYSDLLNALEDMFYIRGAVGDFWSVIYNNDLEEDVPEWRRFRDVAEDADNGQLLKYDEENDIWVNVNQQFDELRDLLKKFNNRG